MPHPHRALGVLLAGAKWGMNKKQNDAVEKEQESSFKMKLFIAALVTPLALASAPWVLYVVVNVQ